jgi:hypothetical protein
MARKASKGTCRLCNSVLTGTGMSKHLQSCLLKHVEGLQESKASKPGSFFHIVVQGAHAPEYWLHLKISSDAKLKALDTFLRDIWLECCGHLSAFRYLNRELGMQRKLRDILAPGMQFIHEYDFGDTTVLSIKVLGHYQGPITGKGPIEILARNDPPEILCEECGKAPAVEICTECQWESKGWLCASCSEEHQCDDEMRLPVVNSPRTGVCGYSG